MPPAIRAHPVRYREARDLGMARAVGTEEGDGDTFSAWLDCGWYNYPHEAIRVEGVDCPETRGADRQAGLAARAFTSPLVCDQPVLLAWSERSSFNRLRAVVYVGSDAGTGLKPHATVGDLPWWNLALLLRHAGHEKAP